MNRKQIACIGIGLAAGILFRAGQAYMPDPAAGGRLERAGYGEGERTEELLVDGLEDGPGRQEPIAVHLGERLYTEEEAGRAISDVKKRLPELIRGDNSSLSEVRMPLVLPGLLENGIFLDWKTDREEILEPDGTVHGDLCPPEGISLTLSVQIRAGTCESLHRIPVRVLPPALNGEEARRLAFIRALSEADKSQQTDPQLILPDEFAGRKLSYRTPGSSEWLAFPFLGTAAALLIPVRQRQQREEEKKRREREMQLDYPGIVSKLTVFLEAGLPVRRAFERIAAGYEKENGKREAYEAVAAACRRMERGMPEIQAYRRWGEDCRIRPYRKLASMLEQNLKNGSERLSVLLEEELESTREEQRNLIRKMGEEASARMVVPLFMILAVVMAVVAVPAFLSFQI